MWERKTSVCYRVSLARLFQQPTVLRGAVVARQTKHDHAAQLTSVPGRAQLGSLARCVSNIQSGDSSSTLGDGEILLLW